MTNSGRHWRRDIPLCMYVHFRHVSRIYETTLFIQYCTVELYMYYLLRNHKDVIRKKEVKEKQEQRRGYFCLCTIRDYWGNWIRDIPAFAYVSCIYETSTIPSYLYPWIQYCTVELYMYYLYGTIRMLYEQQRSKRSKKKEEETFAFVP